LHEDAQRVLVLREVPGAYEVDACIVAAADSVQGEGEAPEGLLDCVFVVRAYVGCACQWERGPLCVGEEGCEVIVVLRRGWGRRRELEKSASEGVELAIDWTV
jgi:hypothetical protein